MYYDKIECKAKSTTKKETKVISVTQKMALVLGMNKLASKVDDVHFHYMIKKTADVDSPRDPQEEMIEDANNTLDLLQSVDDFIEADFSRVFPEKAEEIQRIVYKAYRMLHDAVEGDRGDSLKYALPTVTGNVQTIAQKIEGEIMQYKSVASVINRYEKLSKNIADIHHLFLSKYNRRRKTSPGAPKRRAEDRPDQRDFDRVKNNPLMNRNHDKDKDPDGTPGGSSPDDDPDPKGAKTITGLVRSIYR